MTFETVTNKNVAVTVCIACNLFAILGKYWTDHDVVKQIAQILVVQCKTKNAYINRGAFHKHVVQMMIIKSLCFRPLLQFFSLCFEAQGYTHFPFNTLFLFLLFPIYQMFSEQILHIQ